MPPTATPRNAISNGSSMCQHVASGCIDFVFVEVRDLLKHGIHRARRFADTDHLANHIRKHSAFFERIDNGAALFDRLTHLHQRLFKNRVTRRLCGDS